MKGFIVLSVICLHLKESNGKPAGVSSFAYQDSAGNRYGGTYHIPDEQLDKFFGPKDIGFQGFQAPYEPYQDNGFFPDYFRNLQFLIQDVTETRTGDQFGDDQHQRRSFPHFPPLKPLRPFGRMKPFPPLKPLTPLKPLRPLKPLCPLFSNRPIGLGAFESNLANQALALKAAQKAYDLTSSQGGYVPYLAFRSDGFDNFNMFGGPNSAYAGGFAGPGFTHQIAAINPANPNNPNVNVYDRFSEQGPSVPGGHFVSMSSKSYSSSSNINGKEISNRGSETVVNNDGKITKYAVHS